MNKIARIKLFSSLAVLLMNAVCTACVYAFHIETTNLKILGSFFTVLIVSLAVWVFPIRFYIMSLIFVFFSSSLGSCVNLYHYVDVYDIVVHYFSGVFLFEGGRILIESVNCKRNLSNDVVTVSLFALVFSSACAAFWEIYEFLCDSLIGANMQGTKLNTMCDIIAGVLGALTGFALFYIVEKINLFKQR